MSKTLLAPVAIVLALTLAACGGSPPADSADAPPADSAPATDTATPPADPAAPAAPTTTP